MNVNEIKAAMKKYGLPGSSKVKASNKEEFIKLLLKAKAARVKFAKRKKKDIDVYHGTSTPGTHEIVKNVTEHGVTLNMWQGYAPIKADFKRIQDLGIPIFMDNGSFERFQEFLKKKIPEKEYFSVKASRAYFEYITKEYKKLLKDATRPGLVILTVPEIIAAAEQTQVLQEEFLPVYEALQEEHGFQMIVSMQFNPEAYDWQEQMLSSARAIDRIVPKVKGKPIARVGIPFGGDFKKIQNIDDYSKIELVFDDGNYLDEFKAHLFAAGTIPKVRKFGIKHFIMSIDASSIARNSAFGHYISYTTGQMHDVRTLRGEKGSGKTRGKLLDIMKSEGIEYPDEWYLKEDEPGYGRYPFIVRFKYNLRNFNMMLEKLIKEASEA